MRIMTIGMALLVACGGMNSGSTDAPSGSGGGGGGGGGDAHGSGAGVVDDAQCQTHTFTTTNADGSKTEQTTKFALLSGVDPTSDFVVEECDEAETFTSGSGAVTVFALSGLQDPTCPAGSTCTDSGTAFPAFTHSCQWFKVGQFLDNGQMTISCGSITKSFDKTGALTQTTDLSFSAIRVHH